MPIQAQIEEHLKHIRSIMISFLSKLPMSTKENEEVLSVLYSMLNFSSEQIEMIAKARGQLDKPRKGLFGMGKK